MNLVFYFDKLNELVAGRHNVGLAFGTSAPLYTSDKFTYWFSFKMILLVYVVYNFELQIKPPTSPEGRFTQILSVGIGGSALGPQFVAEALAPDNPPLKVMELLNMHNFSFIS